MLDQKIYNTKIVFVIKNVAVNRNINNSGLPKYTVWIKKKTLGKQPCKI